MGRRSKSLSSSQGRPSSSSRSRSRSPKARAGRDRDRSASSSKSRKGLRGNEKDLKSIEGELKTATKHRRNTSRSDSRERVSRDSRPRWEKYDRRPNAEGLADRRTSPPRRAPRRFTEDKSKNGRANWREAQPRSFSRDGPSKRDFGRGRALERSHLPRKDSRNERFTYGHQFDSQHRQLGRGGGRHGTGRGKRTYDRRFGEHDDRFSSGTYGEGRETRRREPSPDSWGHDKFEAKMIDNENQSPIQKDGYISLRSWRKLEAGSSDKDSREIAGSPAEE